MDGLLLRREISVVLPSAELALSWHALAAAILPLVPDGHRAPTAGELAAIGALQLAADSLLEAYTRDDPQRFARAAGDSLGEEILSDQAVGERWLLPPGRSGIDVLFLVCAQVNNQACTHLRYALGADHLSSDPRFSERAERLFEAEAQLPVPASFTQPLGVMLRRPAAEHPDSLPEQLRWAAQAWREWIPKEVSDTMLQAVDLIAEERADRAGGPGLIELPDWSTGQQPLAGAVDGFAGVPGSPGYVDGSAQFSRDEHWMPNLVLMAKQSYVWLSQLSQTYERDIHRLDQIPDEELDLLAARGFTGLWLIGLWERSAASKEIKRRRGNAEAESSAYALNDYRIADRLGGEEALAELRQRAWDRGLRLAADMVPNHMALDSRWMVEHPERFLQLDEPPFPNYRFDGPDISGDERIGIHLEDGYWSETDAAVVFKRVDRSSGDVRYVYHGNDGTQMPWNDTAQLNYLDPEVREIVIQTIVGVAQRFPVIRFDAAMTLARKHIQRLWYPPPGEGGAIPSRAENSVDQATFNRLLPGEFWREVVDRIKQEAPDTLLLAEAFWMMEGYFVRTLGMHRVYNSAFMHMLRDEDNAKYRGAIKSVLEYSPAILERYVNFMNNPDEETAVEQFGKGDKYFGIATVLATLPGLPMFGHGQIEGFAEKYGMEYSRAYRDEPPDAGFVAYHGEVIFPILRSRHLFSSVEHFALLDFWDTSGGVNENVFAFANRSRDGKHRSLVLYNNTQNPARGWIRDSTAINVGSEQEPRLEQRSLAEALGLKSDDAIYYGLWELRQKKWLLRLASELTERGLYAELGSYGALVFMDVRELPRHEGWAQLAEQTDGGWIDDLDQALLACIAPEPEPEPEAKLGGEQASPEGSVAEEAEAKDEPLSSSD